MAEDMRDALSKLLDVYDARRRADADRERKAKEEEEQFLADFRELRAKLIRPVFEEAGAMLEERGHRYSVAEHEFQPAGAAGGLVEAGISLRIVASGTRAPLHADQSSLSITSRHYNRTVWINSGEAAVAGGIAGAKGAYRLEKLTRGLIEDEVIGFVARVMGS